MNSTLHVKAILFDCDSTLTTIEGIDELAARAGIRNRVRRLTQEAMEGHVPLETVYSTRLDLIKPDLAAIEWLGQRYVDNQVPDAKRVVTELQARGKHVHIVSAGIRQAIVTLGEVLSIPQENIHAVEVHWDQSGQYCGYDHRSPLHRSGGKAIVCASIVGNHGSGVLIGDGINDLEAQKTGIPVIGFGGVVTREIVKKQADFFIEYLGDVLRYIADG